MHYDDGIPVAIEQYSKWLGISKNVVWQRIRNGSLRTKEVKGKEMIVLSPHRVEYYKNKNG